MTRILSAKIDVHNSAKQNGKYNANVERGIFESLADLVRVDNIIWDPVGAFFSLASGYSVYKFRAGGGAVYDPYGEEIFLTQSHIDKLFAIATAKKLGRGAR